LKFTNPKEDSAKTADTISVEVKTRTLTTMQVRTDAPLLIEELMGLLGHGSVFAEHCSLVHGIGGLEGIMVLKSILDTAELDPESSLLDRLLQEFKDSEASELMILMVDYSDAVRQSVDSTIKHYFHSAGNDFKPTAESLKEVLGKAVKVGSLDDLISAIEAKLNLKGKK